MLHCWQILARKVNHGTPQKKSNELLETENQPRTGGTEAVFYGLFPETAYFLAGTK